MAIEDLVVDQDRIEQLQTRLEALIQSLRDHGYSDVYAALLLIRADLRVITTLLQSCPADSEAAAELMAVAASLERATDPKVLHTGNEACAVHLWDAIGGAHGGLRDVLDRHFDDQSS
ncbi:MAG: hypothetical protein AB1725_12570 [Armatimonadota bacterium]